MLKKSLLVAGAAAALAAPALAQVNSSTEQFEVTASVPQTCLMEDITDVDLGEIDIVQSSGPDGLIIESNATGSADQFWFSCNDTNQVTMTSANQGLQNQDRTFDPATDDAGFTDQIFYNLRLDNYVDGGNGAQPKLETDEASTKTFDPRGALHRLVQPTITVLRANNPDRPLAGAYQDTVTISVTTL